MGAARDNAGRSHQRCPNRRHRLSSSPPPRPEPPRCARRPPIPASWYPHLLVCGNDEKERRRRENGCEEERERLGAANFENRPEDREIRRHDSQSERQRALRAEAGGRDGGGNEEKREESITPTVSSVAEHAREEAAEDEQQAPVHIHVFEVRFPLADSRSDAKGHEQGPARERLDAKARRVARAERGPREAHGDPPPRGERGEREGEQHLRIEAVREESVEDRDGQEVPGPVRTEQLELRLEVREVRRDEKGAEKKDVVERGVRRRRLPPPEGRGTPPGPDETSRRGEADREADRRRTDPLVVLLHEEADPRGQEEDAHVQRGADLEPYGNEIPPRDAPEEARLGVRQHAFPSKAVDRGRQVGTHAPEHTAPLPAAALRVTLRCTDANHRHRRRRPTRAGPRARAAPRRPRGGRPDARRTGSVS